MADVLRERREEAEANRRQAEELKTLAERSCREKEVKFSDICCSSSGKHGDKATGSKFAFNPACRSEGEVPGVEHGGGASGSPGVQV